MMYRIKQFIINKVGDSAVIQSSAGVTVLKDSKLIDFFFRLDHEGRLDILESEFVDFFGDEYRSVIDFY